MATINPYLNFMGHTEEAFNFYKSVFGGEFSMFQRFADMPGGDKMSAEDQQKVLHVSLPINGTVLMATDAVESMGQNVVFGNNMTINITPENEAEADRLFSGLSVGGKIMMPLEKAFWGAYFGMLVDKYGVQWMVNLPLHN